MRSGLTAAGDITWELLVEWVWHVVTTLVQGKDWSAAFDSVGVGRQQRALSDRTRKKLQYPLGPSEVHASLPSLSDFEQIWPKGVRIPIHELFLPVESFLRGVREKQLDEQVAQPSLPPVVQREVYPWFGRTRNKSGSAASSCAPVVRPEPCPVAESLETQEPPLPPTTAPSLQSLKTESARSTMPPPPLHKNPVGRRLPWMWKRPSR